MKVAAAEAFQYALPFVEPLRMGGLGLDGRQGILVRVTGDDGSSGLGEIAPLVGHSRESFEEAARETAALAAALSGETIPEAVERLDGAFHRWLGTRAWSPSVRCGFEMAVLAALSTSRGVPLRRLLEPQSPDVVYVGGLLSGNAREVRKKAVYLKEHGYRSAKLKVGRGDLSADIHNTRGVSRALGDACALRLDANGAWDFTTAVEFAREIEGHPIDYIEEPVRNPARIGEFAEVTGLAVAQDESLRGIAPEDCRVRPEVKAVVLKPSMLGLETAVRIGRKAREAGLVAVLSSSFESGLGLLVLAELAAVVQPPETTAGLDTYEWFELDVFVERPALRRPVLDLRELDAFPRELDANRLQPLDHA